jgi:bacteriocin biosynthesis cyclodehydratase domain-containing protein
MSLDFLKPMARLKGEVIAIQRPRIKRTVQRFDAPNGDVYLMRGGASTDIHIEQPDAKDRRLLAAVDGARSRDDLVAEFGQEEVNDLLAQFFEQGLLEDAADDDLIAPNIAARFDRQLHYFGDVSEGPTASECQSRLEAARIAVLGVGGLGGWSALGLACCGIGELLLIDFDRVELTNLNRQVLYAEDDIGESKASAAARRLRAFNSSMRVEERVQRLDSQAAVAEAIRGCDLVVASCDWPAHDIERWINSACFAAGIPFIAMSHFPPVARVGPLYVPGVTGCYACQEIGYRRSFPLFDEAMEQLRGKTSSAGTLGPACELIGGHVSLDVMHLLTGLAEPSTLGAIHIYDLRTMEVEHELISPEPSCPVCGGLPASRSPAAPAERTAARKS